MTLCGGEPTDTGPGPATYSPYPEPYVDKCLEQIRQLKRRMSRQTRFMDAVLRKSILNGGPGPAAYDPRSPLCSRIETCKQHRSKKNEDTVQRASPGPADYSIKHAFKPHPTFYAPFGRLSLRFPRKQDDMPGPSDYTKIRFGDKIPNQKQCLLSIAFGSSKSSTQLKHQKYKTPDDETSDDETDEDKKKISVRPCVRLSPAFVSETPRFQNCKNNSPSPAAYYPTRRTCFQKRLPAGAFCSAEPRFQKRWDWLTSPHNIKTPGPGDYELPLMVRGPRQTFSKSQRFITKLKPSPAPNQYGYFSQIKCINKSIRKIVPRQPNAPVILETFYLAKPTL